MLEKMMLAGGGVILMRNDQFNAPLTEEEAVFAVDNLFLIEKYLRIRRLKIDDWYDVVIFRYLRSVKRWFALEELHQYSFQSIAFKAMQSAIGGEQMKQKRRIQTISLDAIIHGTDSLTLMDVVAG